jgi:putative membrane protein
MLDQTTFASIPLADWNGPGWWIVFVPLGWFAVAFLFFVVFRRAGCGPGYRWRGYGRPNWGPPEPVEVLDRRFAEGEISVEEYSARRSTLEKWAPATDSDR